MTSAKYEMARVGIAEVNELCERFHGYGGGWRARHLRVWGLRARGDCGGLLLATAAFWRG